MSSVDLLCCTLGGVVLLTLTMTTSQHRATPASVRGEWFTLDGELTLDSDEDVTVGIEILHTPPAGTVDELQTTHLRDLTTGFHPALEGVSTRVTRLAAAERRRAFAVSVLGVGAAPGTYRFRVFVSGALAPLDDAEARATLTLRHSTGPRGGTAGVALGDELRLRRGIEGLRLLEPYWCAETPGDEPALPEIEIRSDE